MTKASGYDYQYWFDRIGYKFTIDAEERICMNGDPLSDVLISNILYNLMNNGLKYANRKWVKVAIWKSAMNSYFCG